MVLLWSHDMRFRCPRDHHVVPRRRLQTELWQRLESLLYVLFPLLAVRFGLKDS